MEINGQQTYINLQSEVAGDEKMIWLLYTKNNNGSSENLNPGDTLFTLRKEGKELITTWAKLKPRLSENPSTVYKCFRQ